MLCTTVIFKGDDDHPDDAKYDDDDGDDYDDDDGANDYDDDDENAGVIPMLSKQWRS